MMHSIGRWMVLPAGHQRNLLSTTYKEIGLGMASGGQRQQYGTQVFATSVPTLPNANRTPVK